MSEENIEITTGEDQIIGSMKTNVLEIDTKTEKVHFWRTNYTWDQILEVAQWIKNHRELQSEPEEAPF